ncbi:MAG: hypothetical protein ACM3OB_11360, partial [Acidobacteriota bacterium]
MKTRQLVPFLLVALFAIGALGLATAARADDRALLRNSSANPYVFVILDTSGSMNWAPPCSATDYAAGVCNFLCPDGDCWVPRNGDDEASKFRQAKEALAQVLQGVKGQVNFGFGTYNQDHLAVLSKHYRYKVRAEQSNGFVTLASGHQFPIAGSSEVFGAPEVNIATPFGPVSFCDDPTGCQYNSPAIWP